MDHKNIFEALLAIYKEVGYVQKQKSDTLRYTFAGEGAFIRELRPSLIEHGVTVQVLNMSDMNQITYMAGREGNTTMFKTTLRGSVRFQHTSGTFIDVQSYGEGADTGDKSVNKAMTDMYKYALRQTFMIETGDDPDNSAPPEQTLVREAQKLGAVEKPIEVPLDNVADMSMDLAKSITTSKGKKYGDCTPDELSYMYAAIVKRPQTEETQMKLTAIQTLLRELKK